MNLPSCGISSKNHKNFYVESSLWTTCLKVKLNWLGVGYSAYPCKLKFYSKKELAVVPRKTCELSLLVGKNITERRKRIGLSQEKLAEALDISASSLSRIESGQASPRFSRLGDLAEILQCEIADLFRNNEQSLSVRLETIEDMLKPLSPETQEDLVHLLVVAIQMVKKSP